MQPTLVLVASVDTDLAPLTEQLWARRIAHRVIVAEGQQQLFLADSQDVDTVRQLLDLWQQGRLDEAVVARPSRSGSALIALWQAPLTLLLAAVLVFVFAAMQVDDFWLDWARFGGDVWPQDRFDPTAWWQLGVLAWFKPALLHFSIMHLLFNLAWWWILGRSIERQDGALRLLLITLLTALAGNMAQWITAGPGFGGWSGVTYGLMGWVGWRQYQRGVPYDIPRVLLPLMAGFLLLTMMGESLLPGLSGIANSAHLGGLASGLLLAWVWPLSNNERHLKQSLAEQRTSADKNPQSDDRGNHDT